MRTASLLRQSAANLEAGVCPMAAAKLATRRIASGEPRLRLCAIFLFDHQPQKRTPDSVRQSGKCPYGYPSMLRHGIVLTPYHFLGGGFADAMYFALIV
jgi:hypothetical protein